MCQYIVIYSTESTESPNSFLSLQLDAGTEFDLDCMEKAR